MQACSSLPFVDNNVSLENHECELQVVLVAQTDGS